MLNLIKTKRAWAKPSKEIKPKYFKARPVEVKKKEIKIRIEFCIRSCFNNIFKFSFWFFCRIKKG